jgi:hypothetical protein
MLRIALFMAGKPMVLAMNFTIILAMQLTLHQDKRSGLLRPVVLLQMLVLQKQCKP